MSENFSCLSFTLHYIHRICYKTAVYTTYQGALFENSPNKTEVSFEGLLNDDNNYELNSKLQFLNDKIRQIETDNLRNIWIEICKSSKNILTWCGNY